MTDEFDLIIDYNGEQKNFPAKLLLQGYTHKFKIMINDKEIFFERDEEGSYRAMKMPWQNEKELEKIDKQLLRAIQEKIQAIIA
jgi:hypothetical protein